MWQDGWDELEVTAPDERHRSEVLRVRMRILNAMKRWESAAMLGESMIGKGAQDAEIYFAAAHAVRQSRGLRDATALLLKADDLLAKDSKWHFQLACYQCQLGCLEEAKVRLRIAFELDPNCRLRALEHEDLELCGRSSERSVI